MFFNYRYFGREHELSLLKSMTELTGEAQKINIKEP
jgi:hypothetical protein